VVRHSGGRLRRTPKQRERWLELRVERQRLLAQENPPRLTMIIDRGVLRRAISI